MSMLYQSLNGGPILNEGDLLYLGGLFDGEGSAGVYSYLNRGHRRKDGTYNWYQSNTTNISVNMTDPMPVYFIALCFGGSVTKVTNKKRKKDGGQCKPSFAWRAKLSLSRKIASALIQYVKNPSKVVQLQKVIDYYPESV
jgi:hypothetical protein